MIKIMAKYLIKKISKTKKIKNNKISTIAKLFQQISTKKIMLSKDIKTKLKIIRTQWTYKEWVQIFNKILITAK